MALFITRVELHNAQESDYQILHAAMERLGFSRTIVSASGVRCQLPSAEYSLSSEMNVSSVRNSAKNAANSTGKTSWILTTEVARIDWELSRV